MKEIEISAYCYSEKEDAGIGFGFSCDEGDSMNALDTELIEIGLSESFWENYFEFEPGIEKAKQLLIDNQNLTLREALFAVFGHFAIVYTIGEEESELNLDINVDEVMYKMLEN